MKIIKKEYVDRELQSVYWDMTIPTTHNYVLGNGCVAHNTGDGFSVERQFTNTLNSVAEEFYPTDTTIIVEDSKIGWAKAYRELISLLYNGQIPNYDVSKLRPAGAKLKVFGGRSSGPGPLVELFKFTIELFKNAKGRKLNSLECHDLICKIASVVVVGGVRRSALISLSNLSDDRMRLAKSGDFGSQNPQRYLANNSAVYDEKPDMQQFMNEWKSLYESKSGERGIFARYAVKKQIERLNEFRTNNFSKSLPGIRMREYQDSMGTNPSLRRGTKVWTTSGVFPIEELQDKTFKVRNLHGNISEARCWLSGKNKQLWKIKLAGGHEYFATPEHEWPVFDKNGNVTKKKTPEVVSGDFLPTLKTTNLTDGTDGTYEDGFIIGWNIGDGWITERDTGPQIGFIVSEKEKNIRNTIQNYLTEKCDFTGNFLDKTEINVNNPKLREIFNHFGVIHKKNGLPDCVWTTASEDFRKGLIDGLFSSDGHVEKNNRRLGLTTVHKKLAEDISALLGFYGIQSSIQHSSQENYTVSGKVYDKQVERYDVRISNSDNIEHFKKLFKLSNQDKQEKLDNITVVTKGAKKNPNRIKVLSVELTDIFEDVWDVSVYDETHCFQLSHCVTGNCSEIILRSKQFCNLSEVVVRETDTRESLLRKIRLATILGTFQSTLTNFRYLSSKWKKNTEDERLLGVSLTGILDNTLLNKWNDPNLSELLHDLRREAILTNYNTAMEIGIPSSTAITAVKPSGCTTLDTKIRTTNGVMNMAEIFSEYSDVDNIFELNPGTWLNLTEDLFVYDENDEPQKVVQLFINGLSEVYEIEDENSNVYKFTPEHKLKTVNGWKCVKDITESDEIISFT